MFFVNFSLQLSQILLKSKSNNISIKIFSGKTFIPHQTSKKFRSFTAVKDEVNYQKRQVEIISCGNVYENWRTTRKYTRLPKGPLKFTIEYVDTDPFFQKSKHCALALHGIPGNYSVFSHLINNFEKHGIRLIVPNFPASHYYPHAEEHLGMGLFRQSSEEKVEILKDFLRILNIDKLDMLIAHSSGVYPALSLCTGNNTPMATNSFVLFHVGSDIPVKAMRPLAATYTFGVLTTTRLGYKFLMTLGKIIIKIVGYPIRDDNIHGILMLALTMTYSDISKVKAQFEEIRKKQIPVLYFISENDKVVEKALSLRNLSFLGIDSPSDIWKFDEEGNPLSPPPTPSGNPRVKALSFAKGSHYVFRKYPGKILEEIIKFFSNNVLSKEESIFPVHQQESRSRAN